MKLNNSHVKTGRLHSDGNRRNGGIWMEYRQGNREDLDLFLETRIEFASSLKKLPDAAGFRESTKNYLQEHIDKDDFLLYLALDNGRIISSCMACIITTAPLPSRLSGKSAEVLNVYTLKEYRRQGHAAKLLKMLFSELGRRGVPKIVLEYTDDGFPLYKALGFKDLERQMVLRI